MVFTVACFCDNLVRQIGTAANLHTENRNATTHQENVPCDVGHTSMLFYICTCLHPES